MLTRAIITALDLDKNKVQVRMPLLEGNYKRVTMPQLDNYVTNWASIMYLPGLEVDYRVGDIVIVGFEDNNIGKPLVLGFLKLTGSNPEESRLYGKFIESITSEKFVAPVNSTIGEVTYGDLYNRVLNTDTGGVAVDSVLSDTSTNPVENRVVTKALQDAVEISIGNKEPPKNSNKSIWINTD